MLEQARKIPDSGIFLEVGKITRREHDIYTVFFSVEFTRDGGLLRYENLRATLTYREQGQLPIPPIIRDLSAERFSNLIPNSVALTAGLIQIMDTYAEAENL